MNIEKINLGDALTQSKDLIAENIEKLKDLFPEVVAEGKIDFKALQAILGEENRRRRRILPFYLGR